MPDHPASADQAAPLMGAEPQQPASARGPAPSPPPLTPLEGRSILTDLGAEVVSVIGPVSLCMAATVWLVRTLKVDDEAGVTVAWASAAYSENVS